MRDILVVISFSLVSTILLVGVGVRLGLMEAKRIKRKNILEDVIE